MRKYTPRALLFRLLMLILACVLLLIVAARGRGCPFRNLTGIPCPGCGMSRAWTAFFRLDVVTAFDYHPMFWGVPVLMGYCLFDGQLFRKKWLNHGLLVVIALGTIVNYIVNLVAFFQGSYV
jgi:hypothetical protein